MKKILISGANGFVGQNFINKFSNQFIIYKYNRENNEVDFRMSDVFIHLAGKAEDRKKHLNKDEYFESNVALTKKLFDAFLLSTSNKFIFVSSIKACSDFSSLPITEETLCNPSNYYGESKLMAEQYLKSQNLPKGKKLYILRPCLIHGSGNKGNLNVLYNLVSKGLPWPLGAFENKRSFCSIDNFLFVLQELIIRDDIPSGVYNIADDEPLSTNDLIRLIAKTRSQKPIIWRIYPFLFKMFSRIGDIVNLPLNSEKLGKLTESCIVSNMKIKQALCKELPFSSKDGITKTFQSFKNND